MNELLSLKKINNVAVITLNNLKKKNAISPMLISEIMEALKNIEADDSIRAIIITGTDDVFCAGYDISDLAGAKTGEEFYPKARNIHKLFLEMEDGKPIIAAINGISMGGGLEMTLACDIRIAAESAVFSLPEILIGLLPAAGGMTRFPKLVGMGIAKELVYTGRRVKAEEALRIGLVNKVVPDNKLFDVAMQMAETIAGMPPVGIAMGKKTLNQNYETNVYSATINESQAIIKLLDTKDAQEKINAFLKK